MAASGRRILITTDAVGGVWQYSIDLAKELADAGDTVLLAVLGPSPDEGQRRCARAVQGLRLIETGSALDWMCDGPAPVEQAARTIARLAREHGADIIHCNNPAMAGCTRFPAPLVAMAHGCVATWWSGTHGGPPDPAFKWHGEFMRKGLLAADAVAAPSASFAAALQEIYRLPRRPQVVHNGRPAPAVPDSAEKLDAALTVGRMWDEAKNGALLDSVAGLVDLPLMAAGTFRGPHGEQASFSQLHALGPVSGEKLAEMMARQPIFVSASRFEPFGLAVLEAALAGCALVLSDIPTFRELWDEAALFVDADDAPGFADAITQLHAEPELRGALGEKARLRSARHTPAAMARSVRAIYRTLPSHHEAAA